MIVSHPRCWVPSPRACLRFRNTNRPVVVKQRQQQQQLNPFHFCTFFLVRRLSLPSFVSGSAPRCDEFCRLIDYHPRVVLGGGVMDGWMDGWKEGWEFKYGGRRHTRSNSLVGLDWHQGQLIQRSRDTTAQYITVQNSTAQCSIVQHSIVSYSIYICRLMCTSGGVTCVHPYIHVVESANRCSHRTKRSIQPT